MVLLLPFAAMAQTAETDTGRTALPEAVKTLVFNDCNALIVPDSRSSYETGKMPNGAEVNVSAVLHLATAHYEILTGDVPFTTIVVTSTLNRNAIITCIKHAILYQHILA